MKRINIDLFELQAFAVLAEVQSFRVAAEEVGLSGPALSRLIVRVEEKLGARLFDRDTRNVRITPQGKRLLDLSHRLLRQTEDELEDYGSYLAARSGRVTLAGLPSITAGLLPKLVSRFVSQHPNVEVRIFDALSDGVVAAVLEGRADLGFTAGAVDASDRLSFRQLFSDPFVAVAGHDGPLSEDRVYRWRELVEHPFVSMSPGTSVRLLTEAAFAQLGIALRPRFEVSHLATAGALVAEGLGVSALPALTLPVLGKAPIIVRQLEEPLTIRRIGLVHAAGRTLSPPARAFHDLILSADLDRPGPAGP
jgi:LysR family carnitine catabolism transcriptional activator